MTFKVHLIFVPPGGGEKDHGLDFDMPSMPRPGEYICVTRSGEEGTSDFIVRQVLWSLLHPLAKDEENKHPEHIRTGCSPIAICEYALSSNSSDSHREICEKFRKDGKPLTEMDESGY